MGMEIIVDCPFGMECEKIKDDKIHRCSLFIKLQGKDPQSDKDIDHWGCAFAWLPILLIENAQTNRGQTQALESFRNETIRNQQQFNLAFMGEVERRRNLEQMEQRIGLMLLEEDKKKKLLQQKTDDIIDVKGD